MNLGLRTTTRVGTLFAVVVLLFAGVVSPVAAQTGTDRALLASDDACGRMCDNENPNTFLAKPAGGPSNWYSCGADARTVDTIGPADNSDLRFYGVTIQLRYSPRCRTTWARAYGLQRSDTLWVKRNPGTSFEDWSNDVEYPYNSAYVGGSNWMWSMMLDDAGQTSMACFTPRGHGSRGHVCTRHPY